MTGEASKRFEAKKVWLCSTHRLSGPSWVRWSAAQQDGRLTIVGLPERHRSLLEGHRRQRGLLQRPQTPLESGRSQQLRASLRVLAADRAATAHRPEVSR